MSKRPNFFFIVADRHRADRLGCFGNPIVRTPNIDRIAATGTLWDRGSRLPIRSACQTRASIVTGRMCLVHGARHNGIPLSKDLTAFVELLRDTGYNTELIGKSHLQRFVGMPATDRLEAKEGSIAPSAHLRNVYKNNRQSADYDLEVVPT